MNGMLLLNERCGFWHCQTRLSHMHGTNVDISVVSTNVDIWRCIDAKM